MPDAVTTLMSEQEQLLRETVRNFVLKEAPEEKVKEWDEQGSYPRELFDKIAELGWYELAFAESDRAQLLVAFCEELGRASSDLVALYNLNASGSLSIERYGSEALKQRVIPQVMSGARRLSIAVSEPDVGSNMAALSARATRVDGGWVLSGQKVYCEGAGIDGAIIEVYARTGSSGGRDDITAFLVDADHPRMNMHRMPSLGRNISGVYEIFLEDVDVTDDAVLGEVGQGWDILNRRLTLERLMVSAGFLGCAGALIDAMIVYANKREQFGKPIGAYQGVSHQIADLFVRLDAARCALFRTAALQDAGGARRVDSSMSKLLCGQLYADAAAAAIQIHGAYGYIRDHTIPMHYADGIIATIVAGPPQIHRNVIARHLGLPVSS